MADQEAPQGVQATAADQKEQQGVTQEQQQQQQQQQEQQEEERGEAQKAPSGMDEEQGHAEQANQAETAKRSEEAAEHAQGTAQSDSSAKADEEQHAEGQGQNERHQDEEQKGQEQDRGYQEKQPNEEARDADEAPHITEPAEADDDQTKGDPQVEAQEKSQEQQKQEELEGGDGKQDAAKTGNASSALQGVEGRPSISIQDADADMAADEELAERLQNAESELAQVTAERQALHPQVLAAKQLLQEKGVVPEDKVDDASVAEARGDSGQIAETQDDTPDATEKQSGGGRLEDDSPKEEATASASTSVEGVTTEEPGAQGEADAQEKGQAQNEGTEQKDAGEHEQDEETGKEGVASTGENTKADDSKASTGGEKGEGQKEEGEEEGDKQRAADKDKDAEIRAEASSEKGEQQGEAGMGAGSTAEAVAKAQAVVQKDAELATKEAELQAEVSRLRVGTPRASATREPEDGPAPATTEDDNGSPARASGDAAGEAAGASAPGTSSARPPSQPRQQGTKEELQADIGEAEAKLQQLHEERERANSVEEAEDLDAAIVKAEGELKSLQDALASLGPSAEEIAAREEAERRRREEEERLRRERLEQERTAARELRRRRRAAVEQLQELQMDHSDLTSRNAVLQANLAELLRKRFKEQKPLMKQGEARLRYQGILKDLARFDTENKETKAYFTQELARLQDLHESRTKQVEEAASDYAKMRRRIALQSISSRTAMRMRPSEFAPADKEYEEKEEQLAAARRKHYRLKATLEQAQHEMWEKDKMSGGLHLIDFEQLKIENQAFNEKIEERNEELIRLKRRMSNMVQILTHVKEKLSFTEEHHEQLTQKLRSLEAQLARDRAELTHLKKAKDKLKKHTETLQRRTALLHNPDVVRTYERHQDQTHALKSTLATLEEKRQDTIARTMRLSQRLGPLKDSSRSATTAGGPQLHGLQQQQSRHFSYD